MRQDTYILVVTTLKCGITTNTYTTYERTYNTRSVHQCDQLGAVMVVHTLTILAYVSFVDSASKGGFPTRNS